MWKGSRRRERGEPFHEVWISRRFSYEPLDCNFYDIPLLQIKRKVKIALMKIFIIDKIPFFCHFFNMLNTSFYFIRFFLISDFITNVKEHDKERECNS